MANSAEPDHWLLKTDLDLHCLLRQGLSRFSRTRVNIAPDKVFFFFFFFIWVLWPFQEYFTYIEPIIHQRWAKTGEPGEKPPDHL